MLALTLTASALGCDAPVVATPHRDPSKTEQTCAHVLDTLRKSETTHDAAVLDRVHHDCQTSLTEIEQRHSTLTACLLVARTPEQIVACEQPAKHYDPILRSVEPTPPTE